jgi:hypothetical protein
LHVGTNKPLETTNHVFILFPSTVIIVFMHFTLQACLQAGKENKDAWQAGTMLGPGLAACAVDSPSIWSRAAQTGQGSVRHKRRPMLCHFDRTLLIHPPGMAPSFLIGKKGHHKDHHTYT